MTRTTGIFHVCEFVMGIRQWSLEYALDNNGPIYASIDSCATWDQTETPITNHWLSSSIAYSADANKLYDPTSSGEVWMYQTTPSPELNLTATNGNLQISWIIPSRKIVLQQSTNLFNWLPVTNTAVLIFSNLENQITLPLPGTGSFFRLSTP